MPDLAPIHYESAIMLGIEDHLRVLEEVGAVWTLLDAAQAALPSMLADLRGYVEIETPSDDRAALANGLSWLDDLVADRVGTAASSSMVEGGEFGDFRILEFDGSAADPVLLLAHYDTVWPVGTLTQMPFAVDGDRITGSGVRHENRPGPGTVGGPDRPRVQRARDVSEAFRVNVV